MRLLAHIVYKVGSIDFHRARSAAQSVAGARFASVVYKSFFKGFEAVRIRAVASQARYQAGLPLWNSALPKPFNGTKLADSEPAPKRVVYFPSCINRTMGVSEEAGRKLQPLAEVFVNLCKKAGFLIWTAIGVSVRLNLRCGARKSSMNSAGS